MKVVLLLLATLGVVLCEFCTQDTTSCAHVMCPVTMVPTCESNLCTCNDKPTSSCQQAGDCETMNYWSRHHCGKPHRSCKNGECVCNQHG